MSSARAAVLAYLVEVGTPVTVRQVSHSSGQHANTVRQHLDGLVEDGLVERSQQRPVGRGRPAIRYQAGAEATVLHSTREYVSLVDALAAIRSKNTKPELAVRAALREAGATGYRLHRKDLPGRPNIAFLRWKVAVFVDGAYWHGHPDHVRPDASLYWVEKMARNRARDAAADAALVETGWSVVRIWDIEVKADIAACRERVLEALRAAGWSNSQVERQV